MQKLLKAADSEVSSAELRRFVRSTTAVEILSLVLIGLVLFWSKGPFMQPKPVSALMLAFAACIGLFRARRFFPRQTHLKIAIESWTMLLFISGVIWFNGKNTNPLLNMYLLPVILSALTLGRVLTLLQVLAICAFHMLFAAANPGVNVFSLVYAAQAVGELAPFLLVAYLTTTLTADVTEAREHLENLAQTDALTGVLNMRAFNEIWQRQHTRIEQDKGIYAFLVVDIDKLKLINDTFGHEAGDKAILAVSQCVQRCIRASDSAARMGGGEFAVLLPTANPEIADAVMKRIRSNVQSTTIDVRSRMIRCSVSVGVVSYPKDAREIRDLLQLADRRMRRDKELRRPPAE